MLILFADQQGLCRGPSHHSLRNIVVPLRFKMRASRVISNGSVERLLVVLILIKSAW